MGEQVYTLCRVGVWPKKKRIPLPYVFKSRRKLRAFLNQVRRGFHASLWGEELIIMRPDKKEERWNGKQS